MTPNEQAAYNLLARACYILADIRADLVQYENDAAAQGFVCDINDFFLESIAWLKAWEKAQKRVAASRSSAPAAAESGLGWKAPTSAFGTLSDTSAETAPPVPPSLSPETGPEDCPPQSTSPEVSPPAPSNFSRIFSDFF